MQDLYYNMEQSGERTYSASVGRLVKVKPGARDNYARLFSDESRPAVEQRPKYVTEITELIDRLIVDAFCRRREIVDDDWDSIQTKLEPHIDSNYAGQPEAKEFFYGRLEYMQGLMALLPYASLAQQEIIDKKKIPYDLLE